MTFLGIFNSVLLSLIVYHNNMIRMLRRRLNVGKQLNCVFVVETGMENQEAQLVPADDAESLRNRPKPTLDQAAAVWVSSRDERQVAAILGCTINDVKRLAPRAWWRELCEDVYQRHRAIIDARLDRIVDKSTQALLDRLELGDEIIDRFGARQRVMVPAKVCAQILGTALDRRREQRSAATDQDRLGRIAALLYRAAEAANVGADDRPIIQ